MSGVTDELKAKSDSISKNFDNKELDVLLSSGEQVSCSLLSGALIDLGVKARSWLGWQIPGRHYQIHPSRLPLRQSRQTVPFARPAQLNLDPEVRRSEH